MRELRCSVYDGIAATPSALVARIVRRHGGVRRAFALRS